MQQDGAMVDASNIVLMLHEIYSKAFPLQREASHEDYVSLGCTPTQSNPNEDLDVDPTVEVEMSVSPKDQTNVNATSEVGLSTTPTVLKFRDVEVQISEVISWARSNFEQKVKEIQAKNSNNKKTQ
ncbi:hypothetical protein MKW98_001311, partial [Papaver atlanticum]